MEDYSNFESSSTDVPGNYPEVLMTEGQGNLLKVIGNKIVRRYEFERLHTLFTYRISLNNVLPYNVLP